MAIIELLRKKDIRPICAFAEEKFKKIKGNTVKFQDEKDLQVLFIYEIEVYSKRVIGEAEFKFEDSNRIGRREDILYQTDNAIHIEFKNLKTSHLIFHGERFNEYYDDWEKGYGINREIDKMNNNPEMIFNCKKCKASYSGIIAISSYNSKNESNLHFYTIKCMMTYIENKRTGYWES